MHAEQVRKIAETKVAELEKRLDAIEQNAVQHFEQLGGQQLIEVTDRVKREYRDHIASYAAIIAQIDGLLGV
jgi:phosphoenolpyruvate carboxylase